MCSIEVVDVQGASNVRRHIVEKGVDVAFDPVEEGGEEAAIAMSRVEEIRMS